MKLHLPKELDGFKSQFNVFCQEVFGTKSITAIIGYGSFFKGESDENSDVDIVVLTSTPIRQKQIINVEGIDFEVFYFNIEDFYKLISQRDKVQSMGSRR